jgi:hypothetical protein
LAAVCTAARLRPSRLHTPTAAHGRLWHQVCASQPEGPCVDRRSRALPPRCVPACSAFHQIWPPTRACVTVPAVGSALQTTCPFSTLRRRLHHPAAGSWPTRTSSCTRWMCWNTRRYHTVSCCRQVRECATTARRSNLALHHRSSCARAVLDEVRHRNLQLYNRLRECTSNASKHFCV